MKVEAAKLHEFYLLRAQREHGRIPEEPWGEYHEEIDPGGALTREHGAHLADRVLHEGCFGCFPYHGYRIGG